MIEVTKKQIDYCHSQAEAAVKELDEDRRFDNLIDHFDPDPAEVIENFDDAADRYPDYGEMVQMKFRAIYYRKLAEQMAIVLNRTADTFEQDAKYWQDRYVQHLKSLASTEGVHGQT